MVKYLILLLAAIFASLALIYFFAGVSLVRPDDLTAYSAPHLCGQSGVSLAEVNLAVFYFLPKNKTDLLLGNWQSVFEKPLKQLVEFHQLQFQGRSELKYHFYPRPIIGQEDNIFYDTTTTQYGNPQALRHIAPELEARVFTEGGNLYDADFIKAQSNPYQAMLVIYEGVGAAASENVILLSQAYLSEVKPLYYGTSILAHEFYHSLGLPEGYEIPSSKPLVQDLMGLGRFEPLERTYLSSQSLKDCGL